MLISLRSPPIIIHRTSEMAGHHFRLSFDLSHDCTPNVVQIPMIEFAPKEDCVIATRKKVMFSYVLCVYVTVITMVEDSHSSRPVRFEEDEEEEEVVGEVAEEDEEDEEEALGVAHDSQSTEDSDIDENPDPSPTPAKRSRSHTQIPKIEDDDDPVSFHPGINHM